jgi:hypothetical protein
VFPTSATCAATRPLRAATNRAASYSSYRCRARSAQLAAGCGAWAYALIVATDNAAWIALARRVGISDMGETVTADRPTAHQLSVRVRRFSTHSMIYCRHVNVHMEQDGTAPGRGPAAGASARAVGQSAVGASSRPMV